MEICVKNCNNIDEAKISITPNRLNIKYAYNGSGKSTIAKAIKYCLDDPTKLTELQPFKHRGRNNVASSEVIGLSEIKSVLIFDESYVDQFVFQKDELLKNSFEVFIKDNNYDQRLEIIQRQVEELRNLFIENSELDDLIDHTGNFIESFGSAKAGLSKNSPFYKGLVKGNKLRNIPRGLESYSDYIREDPLTVDWIKWQISGTGLAEGKITCPYCSDNIEDRIDTITLVSKEFDSKQIDYLLKMNDLCNSLKDYFSEDTKSELNKILSASVELSKNEFDYLLEIKEDVQKLNNKLKTIKKIDFPTLKNVEKVVNELQDCKANLSDLGHVNSNTTVNKLIHINFSLDKIIAHAGELQGAVNKQKCAIQKTIESYKKDINGFLRYAGYEYSVEFSESEEDKIKLSFKHGDTNELITEQAKDHLSFGERNAFALVLFMYEAVRKCPDLIILDDPISSFDENKRFALLNRLFMYEKEKCLKSKTVLLFTHDFSIVIDTIVNFKVEFCNPIASFVVNKRGVLLEKEIKKSDIKSFPKILEESCKSELNIIARLVSLRRYFDLFSSNDVGYQYVSSLLKMEDKPTYKEKRGKREMNVEEILEAEEEVNKFISDFQYIKYLDQIKDRQQIITWYYAAKTNFEKLQLYRMLTDTANVKPPIKKFINETYHIENDYLFQIDPYDYDTVPDYIIDECDSELSKMDIN